MIDESLAFAGVTSAEAMVDVGCGVGGSSRHIARKFGCTARGITLSPYQARRANEISAAEGLGDQCSFQVGRPRRLSRRAPPRRPPAPPSPSPPARRRPRPRC